MSTIDISNCEKNSNNIKTILRCLLISEGNRDVTVNELNSMYKEMEGTYIPYENFNHSNLYDFLITLNDTIKLEYNNNNVLCVYQIDTEKSAHISSLISKQKKSKTKKILTLNKHNNNDISTNNQLQLHKTNIDYKEVINRVLQELKPSKPEKNLYISKNYMLYKIKQYLGKEATQFYNTSKLNRDLNNFSHILNIEYDRISFKDKIHSNMVHNSSSNSIPRMNSENYFEDIVRSRNESFQIVSDNKKEFESSKINFLNNTLSESIKIRLQKLIEKHPEGIWCSDLPTLYKNEYNIDLEYNELGFNSIVEFVVILADIFRIVEPSNSQRQMVVNAKTSINNYITNHQKQSLISLNNFTNFTTNDSDSIPNLVRVSRSLIPNGFMNFCEIVDEICVGTLTCEKYIDVNISEIFTPSFFWITLLKNKKKIEALMNQLDEFYSTYDLDALKIPQKILKTGLNIVCTYSEIWHRGIVKEIKPDGFVVIFFYDYGTIKTYHSNDIYFLNKKFSVLPAQAIACGLHNIKPIKNDDWSKISIDQFRAKVLNVPLVASISSVNEKENTMLVTLTDTSNHFIDLNINDWMIKKKIAKWGNGLYKKKL